MSNKAIARRLGISVHTAKFATSGSRPLCLQKRHLLKDESRHGGLLGRRHLSARLHRTCRSEHQRETWRYGPICPAGEQSPCLTYPLRGGLAPPAELLRASTRRAQQLSMM